MNEYYFAKTVSMSMDEAEARVRDALQQEGFGVLTEIDVRATFRKKLDRDFRPYKILGACHPESAYRALTAEGRIGTMLPCNVILQQEAEDRVEVAAVDPVASMASVQNPALASVAEDVRSRLRAVVERL